MIALVALTHTHISVQSLATVITRVHRQLKGVGRDFNACNKFANRAHALPCLLRFVQSGSSTRSGIHRRLSTCSPKFWSSVVSTQPVRTFRSSLFALGGGFLLLPSCSLHPPQLASSAVTVCPRLNRHKTPPSPGPFFKNELLCGANRWGGGSSLNHPSGFHWRFRVDYRHWSDSAPSS